MSYDFKEEKDVKLFLENLLTEYKFGCYGEKNPEICHLLGDYYEAIKKDFKEAAYIYKNNCDNLDYGRSCAKFGAYSLVGKQCEKNIPTGYQYLVKGCEKGDDIGCTNAGILAVSHPEIHQKDKKTIIEKGLKMLKTACYDKNNDKACFYLSGVYYSGIPDILEKSLTKAYTTSLKGCEHGNPYCCANVSQMYARGEGTDKNEELASIFKKRALDIQSQIKDKKRPITFGS